MIARLPIQNLGTPIKTTGGINRPGGGGGGWLSTGEMIVAEYGGNCISIFSPSGEKIRTFGRKAMLRDNSIAPVVLLSMVVVTYRLQMVMWLWE